MDKKDISIATITLVRNDEEEVLLKQSLQQLAELDVPVFITDGGSNPDFLDFLKGFSHFTLSNSTIKGVYSQASNSLNEACKQNTPFIFYTEPDKYDFFVQLKTMLDNISVNAKSGIVIAARSAGAFASFPPFQQMTETNINTCCAEVLAQEFDYTYGPFLLNKKLIPYVKFLKEDVGWGWRPYIFGIAARLGYQLTSYIGDFLCPVDQQHDSAKERLYRIKQLAENMQGLVASASVDLTDV